MSIKHTFITVLAFSLLITSQARGITRRHDVDVSHYRSLAAQFPAVGQVAQSCSGTLVASDKVITAAHCLDENADGKVDEGFDPVGKLFVLGEDINSPSSQAKIKSYAIHPRWQKTNRAAYDVCVLTLETPITAVNPMPLSAKSPVGKKAVTIGFGLAGTGIKTKDNSTLKHAAENILDGILPIDDTVDGTGGLVSDFDHPSEAADYNTSTTLKFQSDSKPINLEGSTGPGDSGGAVTVDFGSGAHLVGITSGGSNPLTEQQSLYGDINEAAPLHLKANVQFIQQQGLTVANAELAKADSLPSTLKRAETNNTFGSGGGSFNLWSLLALCVLLRPIHIRLHAMRKLPPSLEVVLIKTRKG